MRTGPTAVTPFLPSHSPGEAVIGSVQMDARTVDWTLHACAVAEQSTVGEVLTHARVTVRALGVHALPSPQSAMWHSAVVNRQVKLAHPDADPTAAGAPADVVRVIADWDGIRVIINFNRRTYGSLVLDVPYLMALGVMTRGPDRRLVELLLRLDARDPGLAAACLGKPHEAVLGSAPVPIVGLEDELIADVLTEGSAELRSHIITILGERR